MAARRVQVAEQLFTHYREQIYRFCYARLRSREEAEDATQNVFMRVHMALQRGVVPEYEAAWLYKIAHNVCLSKGESVARRARHETPHAFDEDGAVQGVARDVSRDELAGLSEALHAMPPKMRMAIVLREWQGLSYAEIAEAMGLTVPAVETLLFRSRRHLAAALEQGTPKRKRKLAGLFTLPGFLRRLLAAAAPAKLATGAAMVALTGGGVGLGIAVADHPTPGRPASPTPQSMTFLAGTVAGAAAASVPHRAVSVPIPAPLRRTREAHARAPSAVEPAAPPVAAAVPVITPVAEPRQSAPAAQVLPTTVASAAAPIATTTVAVQVPPTPTVSTPSVDVPGVQVPTVSVETPALPVTVTVGGLPLP